MDFEERAPDGHERDDGPSEFKTIQYVTERLEAATGRARIFGTAGMIATFVNLGTFAALLPLLTYGAPIQYLYIEAGFSVTALVVLGFQESNRKGGDGYFQELSDMLQVNWGHHPHVERESYRFLSVQQGRVAARNFASAADLPFVPGKFGPAVYAAVNLVVITVWVIFYVIRTSI